MRFRKRASSAARAKSADARDGPHRSSRDDDRPRRHVRRERRRPRPIVEPKRRTTVTAAALPGSQRSAPSTHAGQIGAHMGALCHGAYTAHGSPALTDPSGETEGHHAPGRRRLFRATPACCYPHMLSAQESSRRCSTRATPSPRAHRASPARTARRARSPRTSAESCSGRASPPAVSSCQTRSAPSTPARSGTRGWPRIVLAAGTLHDGDVAEDRLQCGDDRGLIEDGLGASPSDRRSDRRRTASRASPPPASSDRDRWRRGESAPSRGPLRRPRQGLLLLLEDESRALSVAPSVMPSMTTTGPGDAGGATADDCSVIDCGSVVCLGSSTSLVKTICGYRLGMSTLSGCSHRSPREEARRVRAVVSWK